MRDEDGRMLVDKRERLVVCIEDGERVRVARGLVRPQLARPLERVKLREHDAEGEVLDRFDRGFDALKLRLMQRHSRVKRLTVAFGAVE